MVSTDQAHSLGDVLGIAVPPTGQGDPVRVLAYDPEAGGGFLDALALDTLALLEGRWLHVVETLDRRFPGSELSSIAPEELCALPGIQEVLGLHAVGELAAARRWDRIVVDCASTADALRMLTLPATFGLYVERAWPRHRRLSIGADDGRSAVLAELLERIRASVERLSTLLTDGALVSAHLVLTPERVVAAEAVRTLGSLALMGVRVEELLVNQLLVQDENYEYRSLPDHPAFHWYAERIGEQVAAVAARYPDRFLPFAGADILAGDSAVDEFERWVVEHGFRGLSLRPFMIGRPASDPAYFPCYAKCVELGVPVSIHTSADWTRTRLSDLGHPRHIDDVACRFPELTILMSHGGYPWVLQACLIAWKHPNVYLELAAHRPKYFASPGAGWEPLMRFGQTTIRNKIVYGTGGFLINRPYLQLCDEMRALPVPREVLEDWLWRNATRVLRLDT
ncbi:arsenite-transporting ATPase [Mycobacterium tuberculosis UT0124]|nr:arsenite-transporting ATPase [Mycobacterium tuberculosis UT0124]